MRSDRDTYQIRNGHNVGTPETDLKRYLDDEAQMEARSDAIIRIQEDWESLVYHDAEDTRDYCYIIFKRNGSYGKPLNTAECISSGYGYESMSQAEAAMERALNDCAEEELESRSMKTDKTMRFIRWFILIMFMLGMIAESTSGRPTEIVKMQNSIALLCALAIIAVTYLRELVRK